MASAGCGPLLLALGLALWPAAALGQQGTPPNAPATAPDPAFEAARTAFEALPEAERRAVQDSLVWTGDHNGVVNGQFGRRTFEAVTAYQRRARLDPTGVLDERGRAALRFAAKRTREAAGFEIVTDARTGLRVGIPRKLFPKEGPATGAGGGSRWQTEDERATLDTRAYPPGGPDLPALFERLTASTAPGRRVTYKLLRPDFLVVTGETATGRFYIRYAGGPEGVRGYTLGYDKALAKTLDPLVVAIANSFEPFPGAAPVAAPTPPRIAAPAPPPAAAPAIAPAATTPATGLAVAPRRVLTAAVEGCAQPRVGGASAKVVTIDPAAGLMLLEAEAGRAVPLSAGQTDDREGLVALAYGPGQPARMLMAVAGERAASGLVAPLQAGAAGAPVFDRAGRLVGLVRSVPLAPRLVAGVAIPAAHPLVTGEALARVLRDAGAVSSPEAGAARSAGEIAARMQAAVVPVECGR
ncbi:peptidoglycan-binding protein [Salinarimonas soli]|uniref:peptidoglycan-binding protein n=1 Tax=Salinarimonas soli TaxID=1638099 RepID=UPI001F0ACC7F|nr:peptidoglycan-binding protein [Salinarimonas soli]